MASFAEDLQNFLENRLLAFDPSIDLSPGSPAQSRVIEPILKRLGEDPLDTDVPKFIRDRMLQEFPTLMIDNGGLLEDLFSKPLQLVLEPFKREISRVKQNQSIRNAALLSDDEADALGSNWFEQRDEGDYSGGSVRLYFAAPTTSRVTPEKRFFTAAGLNYFPVENFSITSAQMLFNRQGSLYFLDVVVKAEKQGKEYNIKRGGIIGVDDVPGTVRVANLSAFSDGTPREDNETYLGRFETALTERSIVTKRGAIARIPKTFESIRAVQIIGAGEKGMDRDLLTGTGEGFLHIAGHAVSYRSWLFISEISYKDDGPEDNVVPQVGDLIRFHQAAALGTISGTTAVREAKVQSIIATTSGLGLLILDRSLSDSTEEGRFALFKPGYLTISGIPGGITEELKVPDGTVHLGGHSDVFVRPNEDADVQATLQNVTDDSPVVALTNLQVPTADQNLVQSVTNGDDDEVDFVARGVKPEDLLVIETSTGFAGSFRILEVGNPTASSLRVDAVFPTATSPGIFLRARVIRNIGVDLVEPKIPKLPFNQGTVSDLITNVGVKLFRFTETDIQSYGAKAGDVIRVLDGADAGDFTIQSFGVDGVTVDRPAKASGTGLRFEVFTLLPGISLPLVRLKKLELLDSSSQSTGVSVPYGDTVDVRSKCDFEGAGREVSIYDKQLLVFPDMTDYWGADGVPTLAPQTATAGAGKDARYSQKIADSDGVIRKVNAFGTNPITEVEVNLPPFLYNGRRDKVIVLPHLTDDEFSADTVGNNETSPVAEAKIGDTFTIFDGPNQGNYVIVDLRILELWGKSERGHKKVAVVQIDPELPVDPFRSILDFLADNGLALTATQLLGIIEWSTDWDNVAGFYRDILIDALATVLASKGVTLNTTEIRKITDSLIRSGYAIGPAASGDLRLYFQEPVSAEFYYGTDKPTTFTRLGTDKTKVFRLNPFLDPAQIFPESEEPTPPTQWNRDAGMFFQASGAASPYMYLVSGSPFALRGIRPEDIFEFHSAINDLPARRDMSSSWLCTTQAASNIVQLILPPDAELSNYKEIAVGQLFFIDSGPDTGPYVIQAIEAQDWGTQPPTLKVRLDQALTSTSNGFPVYAQLDFTSAMPAFQLSVGNDFSSPMALATKTLRIEVSTDRGVTWPISHNHTFGAGPFTNASDVVIDLLGNAGLLVDVTPISQADEEIVLRTVVVDRNVAIRIGSSSTAIGAGLLQFTALQPTYGARGARMGPGSTRIYASYFTGLTAPAVGDFITVYAAESPAVLLSGDDEAYLGTFQITEVGSESAAGPFLGLPYIDVDRSAVAPSSGDYVDVRFILHTDAPSTTPQETSGGGRAISNQYVRFRLYDATPKELTVSSFPWTTFGSGWVHPLLQTSENQILLSGSVIASGGKNFGHKIPYRILREGVRRVSSTSLSKRREGALYYVDLPVIGYGPGEEMNIAPAESFSLTGRSKIAGYKLEVTDTNFTYSDKEKVRIILPGSVLPVGSTPELDNEFPLASQNIAVTYNNAPLVEDVQRFLSSPQDRVTVASMLARHFLPSYVSMDISYVGGSDEETVAKDIIKYINSLSSDDEIRIDKVIDLIRKRNADRIILPIELIVLTHGIDRTVRVTRSQNSIGLGEPVFEGTFAQTYFIPGEDTSGLAVRPDGEQIFLKRV